MISLEEGEGKAIDVLVAGFAALDAHHRGWVLVMAGAGTLTLLLTLRWLKPFTRTRTIIVHAKVRRAHKNIHNTEVT